jgi:DNA polymerase
MRSILHRLVRQPTGLSNKSNEYFGRIRPPAAAGPGFPGFRFASFTALSRGERSAPLQSLARSVPPPPWRKGLELPSRFGFNRGMTAEEKTPLFRFLDLAGDYLGDGYRSPPRDYGVPGGPAPVSGGDSRGDAALPGAGDAGQGTPGTEPRAAADSLELVAAEVRACAACPLRQGRANAVPGEGVENPLVMVIGEGPGADEDAAGRPFVGRAGKLLDDMLASRGQIGLYRDKNCFIANVVKCRPPENRDPLPEETAACAPFLARQIALLKPHLILAVGRIAAQTLLRTGDGIGRLRGRFYDYGGIPLFPTYHPSALLRDEGLKRPAWEDLKTLRAKLAELDPSFGGPAKTGD